MFGAVLTLLVAVIMVVHGMYVEGNATTIFQQMYGMVQTSLGIVTAAIALGSDYIAAELRKQRKEAERRDGLASDLSAQQIHAAPLRAS
jgi:hypothetical protein